MTLYLQQEDFLEEKSEFKSLYHFRIHRGIYKNLGESMSGPSVQKKEGKVAERLYSQRTCNAWHDSPLNSSLSEFQRAMWGPERADSGWPMKGNSLCDE